MLATFAVTLATLDDAHAQPSTKTVRIAVLGPTPVNEGLAEAFKQGLGERGYADGRNAIVEFVDSGGRPERLPPLAVDLVRRNVDLIFARGAGALAAAKQATSKVPVVAVDLESDPVAAGFVRSLAQPGGNITGVFLDLPEMSAKQLQLLKEVLPRVSRVAGLGDAALQHPQFHATERAARALQIQPQLLEVRTSEDLRGALEKAKRARANAVVILSSPLVFYHRAEIGALALESRLPTISLFTDLAATGGLMAYGPSLPEAFQRAGVYAVRILQGAKPGELPIDRPTKFEWVINLKTAKVLGLTIPQSARTRADQIID